MPSKLEESTLMDHLMHHIKDNLYFMDREGHIVLISDAGAHWLGFNTPEEVIGKTDLDIFTDEHGQEAYEDEQRIMRTGQPIIGKEEKETWADGRETWVSTTKMPLYDAQGNTIGTFGISRDITARKNADLRASKYAEENRRLCNEMESDLQMAAELQKTFMPIAYPTFPDGVAYADSAARFCHLHHFTGVVGGDFCSVRKLSETEVGILLCEVMGQGVRAAMITALMRAIIEEISFKEKDPGRFLSHMNRLLSPIIHTGEQLLFSTACYLALDVSTGMARYANAEHPVPILLNSDTGQAEWLMEDVFASGPALTIAEDTEYRTMERRLHPDDVVILYTDGLYEATNSVGDAFGQERLLKAANHYRDLPVREMFPQLIREISTFASDGKLDDDVCLVGCRFAKPLNL